VPRQIRRCFPSTDLFLWLFLSLLYVLSVLPLVPSLSPTSRLSLKVFLSFYGAHMLVLDRRRMPSFVPFYYLCLVRPGHHTFLSMPHFSPFEFELEHFFGPPFQGFFPECLSLSFYLSGVGWTKHFLPVNQRRRAPAYCTVLTLAVTPLLSFDHVRFLRTHFNRSFLVGRCLCGFWRGGYSPQRVLNFFSPVWYNLFFALSQEDNFQPLLCFSSIFPADFRLISPAGKGL